MYKSHALEAHRALARGAAADAGADTDADAEDRHRVTGDAHQWFPEIHSSSKQSTPYTVTQYCRRGNEEDPWLSVEVSLCPTIAA